MAKANNRKRLEKQPVSYSKTTAAKPSLTRLELASVKLPAVSVSRVQNQTEQWVSYGDRNAYPQFLVDAERKCAPHAAFLGLRRNLIAGAGLTHSDNIKTALEEINDETTADEMLVRVSDDISTFEAVACQVIYERGLKKIANVYPLPYMTVRPHKRLDDRGNPIGYWVSADWSNLTACPAKFYERFNTNSIGEELEKVDPKLRAPKGSQIFVGFTPSKTNPYFPGIGYEAALSYIELASEISKFALSSVVNGFSSPGILNVIAPNMSDEDADGFIRKFNNTMTGPENAAKVLVHIADNPDSAAQFTSIGLANPAANIAEYNREIVAQVASAHRGNPILAGIATEGASLGGDANLFSTALDVYNSAVIEPLQAPFLAFLKRVLRFNGYTDFELGIAKLSLVNASMSDEMKLKLLKPSVIAAEFGYTEEDMLEQPPAATAPVVPEAPEAPTEA